MKGIRVIILVIGIAMTFIRPTWGQDLPTDVCRIEGDRIIFRINTGWKQGELNQLIQTFNLDSSFIRVMDQGFARIMIDSLGWDIKQLDDGWLEISQPLQDETDEVLQVFSDFFLLDNSLLTSGETVFIQSDYGLNELKDPAAISQRDSLTTIQLDAFHDAREVYLAGTFNHWAVAEWPMQRSDTGWTLSVPLKPGKYHYKFIVDGEWQTDPNNKQTEKDYEFNQNSVLFVYNHRFSLKGFERARRVVVAGSFNGFDPRELKMEYDQTAQEWYLDLFLKEGTWYYKFVVDGDWILDPANPDARPDGRGNENSVLGIGEPQVFFLEGFQDASDVILAGSFNDWNTEEIRMSPVSRGWTTAYTLGSGTYTYKYIIDGQWTPDPFNPSTIGTGAFTNSVLVVNPNHTFILKGYPEAEKVYVTGTFNDWSHDGYRMEQSDGKWTFQMHLAPGKYSYKFIVDGNWILDPDNEFWEENRYGTDNSVLWIE